MFSRLSLCMMRVAVSWLWWLSWIFLLLRPAGFYVSASVHPASGAPYGEESNIMAETTISLPRQLSTAILSSEPKTLTELGIPECDDSAKDCAYGGKCILGPGGRRSCLCPASCPGSIPVSCQAEKNDDYCMSMSDDYREKYSLPEPACHMGICVCPPMFDPWKMYESIKLLPFKCDRRQLKVQGVALPADSVYQGTDAMLLCCINMDPRTFVTYDGIDFIQNSSIIREPTNTPYDEKFTDGFAPPRCWSLDIKNAQFSDGGSYLCHVRTIGHHEIPANFTIEFAVKAPRMIQNVTVKANATHAEVNWDTQEGPMLTIEFKLVRRTDGVEVWAQKNAKPSVVIGDLFPATPYTLFISVYDGQNDPFKITEQFTTAESAPEPPSLGEIRLLNWREGVICEVEWTPPKIPNGRIIKYYVTVRGTVRYTTPGGSLISDDFPVAEGDRCDNYNGDEGRFTNADAIADFYSCRFGPLKPNRNYTATVWAENGAGKSQPIAFAEQCVTNYAQPDLVDAPASLPQNGTSFGLVFSNEPDETNGPIACYYMAVVPLDPDAVIERLPPPDSLVVDTFAKAIGNNIRQDRLIKGRKPPTDRRYFAYIAESYMDFPRQTLIGDGNPSASAKPCNVLYLSRHRPEDPALRSGLKYTGFLIVRVDRDEGVHDELLRQSESFFPHRKRRRRLRPNRSTEKRYFDGTHWFSYREESELIGRSRSMRQLQISGPAYGFSSYFKPVLLNSYDARIGHSLLSVMSVILSIILFIVLVSSTVIYILHRHGLIRQFCPRKAVLGRKPVKASLKPTPVELLAFEYTMRRRDTEFLFRSEFEKLPHYESFEARASDKPDNSKKNRYGDIKAYDTTRVKLSQFCDDPSSDYINANFIKGYKGKRTFIATQGPVNASINDFWRMIWEHQVHIIVMLANLTERNRPQCAKYWPDEEDGAKMFDKIEVRPVERTLFNDYAIRTFELQRPKRAVANGSPSGHPAIVAYGNVDENGFVADATSVTVTSSRRGSVRGSRDSVLITEYANANQLTTGSSKACRNSNNCLYLAVDSDVCAKPSDVRKVIQYHFTSWNDLQAPETTTELLRFLSKLRKLDEYSNYPVVVHCSAGVGRTGTFIAIDTLMDQCVAERQADVFGIVSEMRKQRNKMVQNHDQYMFIYKALAEWFTFGETDIDAEVFSEYYQKLREPIRERQQSSSSSAGNISAIANAVLPKFSKNVEDLEAVPSKNGFELEFERLKERIGDEKRFSFARAPDNLSKNRFENAIPYDQCRVVLSVVVGSITDTTYINASMVKGYLYPYILAQDPIDKACCYDFWRMIGEKQAKVVVMLSTEEVFEENEKYWPRDVGKTMTFGTRNEVSVKLISEETCSTYTQRTMTYKFAMEKVYHEVTQFVYLCWPNDSPVPSSTHSLVDLVSRVLELQSRQEKAPIVLHSRDGSSETGVFCCVSQLLERHGSERKIDVFQTVRSLQQSRKGVFEKLEQYIFCYNAVMDYLGSTPKNFF